MAKCRIQTLTPDCGYVSTKLAALHLLDLEDYVALIYRDGAAYNSCYVDSILRQGSFISIDLRDSTAQYTGTLALGVYTHRIELFINQLSAELLSNLHLATKRPQVVVMETLDGKLFVFGQDGGASVTYNTQTAEGEAAAVFINNVSQFPLYEASPTALSSDTQPFTYSPVFTGSTACQVAGGVYTGNLLALYAVRVSLYTGESLDANGRPVSVSGLPAAVLVLAGESTPVGFTKVGEYNPGAVLNGQPTIQYSPSACPDGTTAPWVLDGGIWNPLAYWFNNGIWNF